MSDLLSFLILQGLGSLGKTMTLHHTFLKPESQSTLLKRALERLPSRHLLRTKAPPSSPSVYNLGCRRDSRGLNHIVVLITIIAPDGLYILY